MSKAVSIQVNQENLVNNLRYAFSNSETVLSELMQNARRAGASAVHFNYDEAEAVLEVTDDGSGITDMQNLLTVADSGWDDELKQNETPFGMGWLSCLFAAEHVLVQSGEKQIAFDTGDILLFRDAPVTRTASRVSGARIVLSGFMANTEDKMSENKMAYYLDKFAYGFPIDVYFNGEKRERNDAIDSGKPFQQIDIGKVYFPGFADDVTPDNRNIGMRVYLQGLPVYATHHSYMSPRDIIVHLDPTLYFARLPDRDCLINESEQVLSIQSALAEMWRNKLQRLIDLGRGDELLSCAYWNVIQHFKVDRKAVLVPLLNQVDALPAHILYSDFSYPRPALEEDWYSASRGDDKQVVTRKQIEAGEIALHQEAYLSLDTTGLFMFLYQSDRYMIDSRQLAKDHWAQPYIKRCEEAVVRPVNPQPVEYFAGEYVDTHVVFCDAYEITLGDETCLITNAAIGLYDGYQRDEQGYCGEPVIYIPAEDPGDGEVLMQISTFQDEYENRNDDLMYKDINKLEDFIALYRQNDPIRTLKKWIESISMIGDERIRGVYRLELGAHGVEVTALTASETTAS